MTKPSFASEPAVLAAANRAAALLGVAVGADELTLRAAWRTAARHVHPDTNSNAQATQLFVRAQRAFDLLVAPYKGTNVTEAAKRFEAAERDVRPVKTTVSPKARAFAQTLLMPHQSTFTAFA